MAVVYVRPRESLRSDCRADFIRKEYSLLIMMIADIGLIDCVCVCVSLCGSLVRRGGAGDSLKDTQRKCLAKFSM